MSRLRRIGFLVYFIFGGTLEVWVLWLSSGLIVMIVVLKRKLIKPKKAHSGGQCTFVPNQIFVIRILRK